MTALEDLTAGASVRGLLASGAATVESVQWIGQQTLEIIFRDGEGRQIRLRPVSWLCPRRAGAVAKHGRPVVVVVAVEEYERLTSKDISERSGERI